MLRSGNRPSGEPADRGTRSDGKGGGPGGETAGDHGGEAAGGLGRLADPASRERVPAYTGGAGACAGWPARTLFGS